VEEKDPSHVVGITRTVFKVRILGVAESSVLEAADDGQTSQPGPSNTGELLWKLLNASTAAELSEVCSNKDALLDIVPLLEVNILALS
jgi:hypothetical protein